MKIRSEFFIVFLVCFTVTSLATHANSQRRSSRIRPSSASKVLSRVSAANLIKAHPDFKSNHNVGVPVGPFCYDGRNVKADVLDKTIQRLVEKGLLTFSETDKSCLGYFRQYIVELTPAGETQVKSWILASEDEKYWFLQGAAIAGSPSPEAKVFWISVATRQLVQVTGIAVDASGTEAGAEFTWKWARTAHAQLVPNNLPTEELHPSMAFCKLYDDGWRIAFLNLHGLGLP